MPGKSLRGGNFKNAGKLSDQVIKEFCGDCNTEAKPFVRRKREINGGRLRNTRDNFR